MAVAIDSGKGVDGSDHGIGGDYADVLRALDDVPEGEAEVAVALVVKVDGPRVSIDGVRRNLIAIGDTADTMPVNEILLDGFAERVSANLAEAFVVTGWDENAFLHESEFLVWSQRTFAARTLLVFFFGRWRRRIRHGWRSWFGDGCGRLRRRVGWGLGSNRGRRRIVFPNQLHSHIPFWLAWLLGRWWRRDVNGVDGRWWHGRSDEYRGLRYQRKIVDLVAGWWWRVHPSWSVSRELDHLYSSFRFVGA